MHAIFLSLGGGGQYGGPRHALDAVDRDKGGSWIERIGHFEAGGKPVTALRAVDGPGRHTDLHQPKPTRWREQSGRDDFAGGIDDLSARRHRPALRDRDDAPVIDDNRRIPDRACRTCRMHSPADDSQDFRSARERQGDKQQRQRCTIHGAPPAEAAVPSVKSVTGFAVGSPRL